MRRVRLQGGMAVVDAERIAGMKVTRSAQWTYLHIHMADSVPMTLHYSGDLPDEAREDIRLIFEALDG